MNHIKTKLCIHFIGIDKLERLKLMQGDAMVNEFDISVKEPETVSRFSGNISYKTTLLFKIDSVDISEYRQQIKTLPLRLMYVFLGVKIIRTARYVVMKLPAKYPSIDLYENCLS